MGQNRRELLGVEGDPFDFDTDDDCEDDGHDEGRDGEAAAATAAATATAMIFCFSTELFVQRQSAIKLPVACNAVKEKAASSLQCCVYVCV